MALSASEEAALIARYRAGDRRATDEIIKAFAPIVKSFVWKRSRFGVDKDDMSQEGMVALFKALERFDPANGNRFAVYAKWWVRAYIDEFISRNWSMVRGTQRERGRSAIVTVYNSIGRGEGSRSMNAKRRLGGEGSREWGDTFIDPAPSPEEACMDGQRTTCGKMILAERMKCLNDKERAVLTRRWLSEGSLRLHDLASEMGVTTQRVQQIERSALDKIGLPALRYPLSTEI